MTIDHKIQININVDVEPCSNCSDGQITGEVSGFGAPPFTYRWNDANEQTTLKATGLPAGEYVLLVTDANGCFNSDTVSIGITSIGIIENRVLEVYPNPNNGRFTVILPNKENSILKIFDAQGSLVKNELLFESSKNLEMDLMDGVYFLEALSDDYRYISRVVISNR